MSYAAKVIADSMAYGVRLTSFEVTFPRFELPAQNTHRMFTRSTASSRAIPVDVRCASIEKSPFVPAVFGKNQKGMQASEILDPAANAEADKIWREAAADAVKHARRLAAIKVHKEYANRLTEPYAWVTQLVTTTEINNYFALRCHKDAQGEIRVIAEMMREAMHESTPRELDVGDWHLPYVGPDESIAVGEHVADVGWVEPTLLERVKISVARCAALSFERQHVAKSLDEYTQRHDMLLRSRHLSPFEHQAQVVERLDRMVSNVPYGRPFHPTYWFDGAEWCEGPYFCGNFRAPFLQYRKMIRGENVFEGGL